MNRNSGDPEARGWSRREWLAASAAATAALWLGRTAPALAADSGGDAAPSDLTPAQALQRLIEGNQRFASGKARGPHRSLERVHELSENQQPFAAILACADSRVPVELVFDQGFGDLFVVRNAGNVAAPQEFASLEYGVGVLHAKVLFVLGHTSCGAVKAAIAGKPVPGQISVLYQHLQPAVDAGGGDVAKTVAENVRVQARLLKQSSTVVSGLAKAGKLQLAGGIYDLATGAVTPVAIS